MKKNQGQVMILTVIALGATILGATTIAGLLISYQVRDAGNAANSTRAIFAADTGMEWALYQLFHPESNHPSPTLINGASYSVRCFTSEGANIPCTNASTTRIRSVGEASGVNRALELRLE